MKRGQAAMEFLMTYGWAILAAIIAIGVLYLIIGNPANIVGDRFTITEPFIAVAKAATISGVTIEVKNGAGVPVTINSTYIQNCGTDNTIYSVAIDATQAITVSCTLTAGNRIKGNVVVSYTTVGSTVTQKSSGSVNLKVA